VQNKISTRKGLIKTLKKVIRGKYKLQRQIQRKYQQYQELDEMQEQLKQKIKVISIAPL
jgi:cell division protein FtsB